MWVGKLPGDCKHARHSLLNDEAALLDYPFYLVVIISLVILDTVNNSRQLDVWRSSTLICDMVFLPWKAELLSPCS